MKVSNDVLRAYKVALANAEARLKDIKVDTQEYHEQEQAYLELADDYNQDLFDSGKIKGRQTPLAPRSDLWKDALKRGVLPTRCWRPQVEQAVKPLSVSSTSPIATDPTSVTHPKKPLSTRRSTPGPSVNPATVNPATVTGTHIPKAPISPKVSKNPATPPSNLAPPPPAPPATQAISSKSSEENSTEASKVAELGKDPMDLYGLPRQIWHFEKLLRTAWSGSTQAVNYLAQVGRITGEQASIIGESMNTAAEGLGKATLEIAGLSYDMKALQPAVTSLQDVQQTLKTLEKDLKKVSSVGDLAAALATLQGSVSIILQQVQSLSDAVKGCNDAGASITERTGELLKTFQGVRRELAGIQEGVSEQNSPDAVARTANLFLGRTVKRGVKLLTSVVNREDPPASSEAEAAQQVKERGIALTILHLLQAMEEENEVLGDDDETFLPAGVHDGGGNDDPNDVPVVPTSTDDVPKKEAEESGETADGGPPDEALAQKPEEPNKTMGGEKIDEDDENPGANSESNAVAPAVGSPAQEEEELAEDEQQNGNEDGNEGDAEREGTPNQEEARHATGRQTRQSKRARQDDSSGVPSANRRRTAATVKGKSPK